MGYWSVQIEIDVTQEQLSRLAELVGGDPEQMAQVIATAGATELLENFTGTNTSANLTETKKLRTLCLLLACQGDIGVATRLVKRLYGVTDPQAQNLIAAATARFPVESREAVNRSIQERLEAAEYKNDRWYVRLQRGPVLESVLERTAAGQLPDPERAGMGDVWRFADETYQQVRKDFGLQPRPVPKRK
jgi:hypothetical protein